MSRDYFFAHFSLNSFFFCVYVRLGKHPFLGVVHACLYLPWLLISELNPCSLLRFAKGRRVRPSSTDIRENLRRREVGEWVNYEKRRCIHRTSRNIRSCRRTRPAARKVHGSAGRTTVPNVSSQRSRTSAVDDLAGSSIHPSGVVRWHRQSPRR